jgi:hypothetical protein
MADTIQKLREQFSKAVDKASVAVGISEPKPKSLAEQFEFEFQNAVRLSYTTRIYGFGICVGLGCLISLFSFLKFSSVLQGDAKPFVIIYSVGNIIAVMSTFFLWGPCAQLKSIFKMDRLIGTIVYFSSIALTITMAVHYPKLGLLLLCIAVQFCALVWYTAASIPGGRAMLTGCCKGLIPV